MTNYALREQQVCCSSGFRGTAQRCQSYAPTQLSAHLPKALTLQPTQRPCRCAASACLQLCLQGIVILQQGYGELANTQAALFATHADLVATQAEVGRIEADLVAVLQQLGQAQQRAQDLQQQLDNQAGQLQVAMVRGGVCRWHGHIVC